MGKLFAEFNFKIPTNCNILFKVQIILENLKVFIWDASLT